jgi:hypothetical protein
MNECRNCGATAVKDLGFIGELAPFFLKRLFNMEVGISSSPSSGKRFIQRMVAGPHKVLSRIRRTHAMVEMQACSFCSFVQSKHPFSDESLGQLYRDYRSETYNHERCRYEPSYKSIAEQVGAGEQETRTRIETLTAWVSQRITPGDRFSMLDYGGADGNFLPRLPGTRYVYEISDIKPVEGIVSIRNESELGSYSYIQLSHILEHVPRPLELVVKVSQRLEPEGRLYIEVPQDFSQSNIDKLVAGSYRGSVPIHEHINLYTEKSAAKLIEAAGLQALDVEVVDLDYGWAKPRCIRVLGRRK